MLPGPTLWSTVTSRLWSILLDETYPGLQQRNLDGVGYPSLCDSWYGYVTPSRSQNHLGGSRRQRREGSLLGISEVGGHHHLSLPIIRLCLVWNVRTSQWNRSRQCHLDHHPTHLCRYRHHHARWDASERLRNWVRNLTFHCHQYLWVIPLEVFQSHHYEVNQLIWVWRCHHQPLLLSSEDSQ